MANDDVDKGEGEINYRMGRGRGRLKKEEINAEKMER